jgi:nucleoside 2-deoxyribosyltransferase
MNAENEKKLSAFVLMPFNEEANVIFDELIAVPLKDVGYEVRKADSVIDQRSVLSDIVLGIDSADLIVADLTGLNPNVFYELGIAHGLGIPTVLITQSLDEIPFDLKTYRTSEYSTRFDEAENLQAFLREVGKQAADGQVKFASPVSDYLRDSPAAERLAGSTDHPVDTASAPQPRQEIEREDGGEPDLGTLDLIHLYIQAAETTTAIMTEIGEETGAMGDKIAGHTVRMQEAMSSTKPGAVAQVHRISTEVASDLDAYGDVLKRNLPVLEKESDVMIDYGLKWLGAVGPDQTAEDLESFRISLATMYLVLMESIPQTRTYRDSFHGSRGITSQLTKASDRVVSLLDRMLTVMEKTQSFGSRGCDIAQEILDAGALYMVIEPLVQTFADPMATQEQPFSALFLATFDRGVVEAVHPYSGPPLQKHAQVSGEFEESRQYPESWFRHPYTEVIEHAWETAAGFTGKELKGPADLDEGQLDLS